MQLHLLQQDFLIRLIYSSVLCHRTKGIKGWWSHFERTLTFAQEAVLIKKTPCRMLTGLIVAKIKRRMKVKTKKKWYAFEILEIFSAWKCLICKNTSSCSSSRWGNFKMWQCHPFERGKKRGFGVFWLKLQPSRFLLTWPGRNRSLGSRSPNLSRAGCIVTLWVAQVRWALIWDVPVSSVTSWMQRKFWNHRVWQKVPAILGQFSLGIIVL